MLRLVSLTCSVPIRCRAARPRTTRFTAHPQQFSTLMLICQHDWFRLLSEACRNDWTRPVRNLLAYRVNDEPQHNIMTALDKATPWTQFSNCRFNKSYKCVFSIKIHFICRLKSQQLSTTESSPKVKKKENWVIDYDLKCLELSNKERKCSCCIMLLFFPPSSTSFWQLRETSEE